MEVKYKINSRLLILLMLGTIMTCSAFLMFVYHPLQLIIKKVATLAPGTIFTKLWSAPPYSVYIDTFIFNVTNSEEFLAGKEKLKVVQVGPYVYQEILLNNNATFNEDGTMTFQPRRYLKFQREMSVGDPKEDRIISPNIPLLGITASLENDFFANLAVSGISKALNTQSFLNLSVAEYLWGYDDQLVTLAHKAIPSWINFERFGILDRLMALDNASNIVTLNLHPDKVSASPILTEAERLAVYHIHRWNGSPGLKHWGYIDSDEPVATNSRCNMVEGAFDGTVFPPNVGENTTLKMYRRAFCRPVPFNYKEPIQTKTGHSGLIFEVDPLFLATPKENPENSCYCVKGKCPLKGLGSLSPCYYDIPIMISQPHFYNAHPVLLQQIEGMQPNKEDHDSYFVLQPQLGVPIEASLKIQINLDIGQTRYNAKTEPFNGLVLPLFWLQMRLGDIPHEINLLITILFQVLPVIQQILIYLLGLCGLGLMSASALLALFVSRDETNGRLSFRGDYSPIPIIPINSPYFKPDVRILK
ncbi:lysosome membrane protein 2 [Zophobas morio]|uniref:lysosome membrane protein 2 n=1 Tax=Zophobas morio TaxID=2755281 RepID=UPI0030829ED4